MHEPNTDNSQIISGEDARDNARWYVSAGFALILILMFMLVSIGLNELRMVTQDLERIVTVANHKISAAYVMRDALRQRAIILRDAMLSQDPFERDELSMAFSYYASQYMQARDRYRQAGIGRQEELMFQRFVDVAKEAQPHNYLTMQMLLEDRLVSEVAPVFELATEYQGKLLEILDELVAMEESQSRKMLDQAQREYVKTRQLMLWLSLLVLFLSVAIAAIVIRTVGRNTNQMHFHAIHDSLTGLLNRGEFERRVKQAIRSAKTSEAQHVLLYLDLDDFKIINDTSGHAAGDKLLAELASVMQKIVRRTDTLARLGGDEFGVLLTDCKTEVAVKIAEKIRRSIDAYRLYWQGGSYSVSVSIGIVSIDENAMGLTEIMCEADNACYAAKDSGRNRVYLYQEEDAELIRRGKEMRWVNRLREALSEDKFILYVQPIQVIDCAMADGYRGEILLRLQGPDGEILSPGEFMPAAERFHIMPQIDRWVIKHVVEHLRQDARNGAQIDVLAVNLSGASLSDQQFIDYLDEVLEGIGDLARRLCFEITETITIQNLQVCCNFIEKLKAYGCHVALDDFGTGMSSFSYLKNLKVDYVKIDGSFVRDIAEDAINYEIVRLINAFAQTLGIRTVAEYVESNAVLAKLRALEVDFVQGYAVSAPLPLGDAVPLPEQAA